MQPDNNYILEKILESNGVSIDSRKLNQGEVFIALKGPNFDGNKYIPEVLANGAALAISSDAKYLDHPNVIVVKDTLLTLQNIANLYRQRYQIPVIAITGTNGKTTTKEILYQLLSKKFNVLKTEGNLNNHIGVPLMLLKLKEDHQMAIIEMGASKVGDIEELCNIAEPTHGLITSIGKAHISGFGSFENIIKTKTELADFLCNRNSVFFMNKNIKPIKYLLELYENTGCLIYYDESKMNGNTIMSLNLKNNNTSIDFDLVTTNNDVLNVKTKIYGNYNFDNIVNSIKIADYFGVNTIDIITAIENFESSDNRSQVVEWKTNTLIMDAYNANPTSMKHAIESFDKIKNDGRSKILILGDMLELGTESVTEHVGLIESILESNQYKKIFLIGNEFVTAVKKIKNIPENLVVRNDKNNIKDMVNSLENNLVLVKGSRGIQLEKLFL